jgi:hypothetical protein
MHLPHPRRERALSLVSDGSPATALPSVCLGQGSGVSTYSPQNRRPIAPTAAPASHRVRPASGCPAADAATAATTPTKARPTDDLTTPFAAPGPDPSRSHPTTADCTADMRPPETLGHPPSQPYPPRDERNPLASHNPPGQAGSANHHAPARRGGSCATHESNPWPNYYSRRPLSHLPPTAAGRAPAASGRGVARARKRERFPDIPALNVSPPPGLCSANRSRRVLGDCG